MLKLRKNKKGFTLVELIVVIAIMAVLAGVVAGVTVSQLNKQTDKTGQSQANTIAQFLSQCILTGETEGVDKITTETTDANNVTTTAFISADDLQTVLDKQYSSSSIEVNQTGGRGKIAVTFVPNNESVTGTDAQHKGSIKIYYQGKQSGAAGNATYYVAIDGTISK